MWVGIARMREHLTATLEALPPGTSPIERILAAVEAHLRYELTISDYTTASIRNAGQLPEHIRARQVEEESKYGIVWRNLFNDAKNAGQLQPDLDPYLARMLVMGALNWAAEWWTPRSGSMSNVVKTAQAFIRSGIENPQR
jgi:hypothetical protein